MPSRREREKQERLRSKNGVPGPVKSCQARHPVHNIKCFKGKPCESGTRHMAVVSKPGGGFEKLYWSA